MSTVWRAAAVAFTVAALCLAGGERLTRVHYVMGTLFEITVSGSDRERAAEVVEEAFAAIRRADERLSHYRAESELSRWNRSPAGEWTPLSSELSALLSQSFELDRLSGGAFRVTVAPLTELWKRAAAGNRTPRRDELAVALAASDPALIEFRAGQARRLAAAVRVEFGAIGKGWAVDRAVAVLRARGIRDALVSAGTSTLYAMGTDGEETGWRIAIRDPSGGDGTVKEITLREMAVSTSASYEQFREIQGRRYSHILDPRNGRPVEGMRSVTVIAPSATEADALSTAVYVLGMEAGRGLLTRLGRVGYLYKDEGASP